MWKIKKVPNIYLFFKKETTNDLFKAEVHSEVGKVIDFEKSQQPNGFCNPFLHDRDFERKITDLLWSKAFTLYRSSKVKQKQVFLDKDIKTEIAEYQSKILVRPPEYISRSTSHFSFIKERQNTPFLEVEKEALDQLILTKNRIVLLGDAGSGKSTELQDLSAKLNQNDSPLIPLFQNLNTYTPDQGLDGFLPEFWQKIPGNLLLVIWDGLDEIQPEHFNTVIRQISSFSEKHKDIRIIISCRTNFYELPINNSSGTLAGFDPYIINDLGISDVKSYFQKKCEPEKADDFVKKLFENKLTDLVAKPFFLMLLAENYARESELLVNRAKLYEMFLLNRIELDERHYKGTFNIRGRKLEIVHLLEKVALSMEILTKNHIKESEIIEIISNEDFRTLRYCTAFKKKDGEESIWQFEHNNIQEYLAAKALAGLDYNRVIKFLTFEPQNKKLIPSWVNTLTFLFSILKSEDKLFKQLLKWLLANEKGIIVKFERDKILEKMRNEIFQGIFSYYKGYDVWISSNKFSDRELAQFGQSEANLHFLFYELKKEGNSRTIKLNAIGLVGHFDFRKEELKQEVAELLLNQIEANTNDPYYIHTTIYALKDAELTSKGIIDRIMNLVGDRKNQEIRAAVYAILLESDVLEEYVDYLIDGYELIDKKVKDERDDVSFLDESWSLRKCVKKVKSPAGIKKLIEYVAESTRFDYGYDTDKVLKAIIENAIVGFQKDYSIYDSVLNWFIQDIRESKMEKIDLAIMFFEKTNTREKAFYAIWAIKEDKEKNKSLAIAKLITPDLMQFVIDQYNKHDLTNKQLENIYFYVGWVRHEEKDKFEVLIKEKTKHVIEKPKQIDYEGLRKMKLKEDFNLLFTGSGFLKEAMRVFEEQDKQQKILYEKSFLINKTTKNKLKLTGALLSCI